MMSTVTLAVPPDQVTLAVAIYRLPHAPEGLPHYATNWAAGMDLQAALDAPVTLQPLERALIPTGFIIALPEGYEAQIRARSGLSIKHGVTLINGVGTIDADYRHEVKVALVNLSNQPFVVEPGMRVAQMVVAPVTRCQWHEVSTVPDVVGNRHGGFGSTGLQ
jgi:dUTP pyrophosphatase